MKILLAGGGSIGHLAPCVAVARALEHLAPDCSLHVICARREEEITFLQQEHLPHTAIPLPHRSFALPFTFLRALREAGAVLDSFHPDAVFCKGGAVSVPVALAARRRNIPIILHESDAVMGRANRLIARWANAVCMGMGGGGKIFTGNPIRPGLTEGTREEGLHITGFSGTRPVLLVIGGSQGAQALNKIVIRKLQELLTLCDVIHVTGQGKTGAPPQRGYWCAPFVHAELPHLYAVASVALSRSGAGLITELAGNGIPAIFAPLCGVAQDHQEANARTAEESGGCIVLEQKDAQEQLIPILQKLLADPGALPSMEKKMRTLHRADAAKRIAAIILETTNNR